MTPGGGELHVEWRDDDHVILTVAAANGNKTHAARILGIDRRSLYRRLEEPRNDQRKDEPAAHHAAPRSPTSPPTHVTPPPAGGMPGDME